MEINAKILKEIAIEYFDVDDKIKFEDNWNKFMYCYEKIRFYPCVVDFDSTRLIDCLYLIAEDIASDDFFKTTEDIYGNKFYNYDEKHKSLDHMISESLYRIYDEAAIANLSEEYRKFKRLKVIQESD